MDSITYEKLTARERELLRFAATGATAKEIGRACSLSYRTVQQMLHEARGKMGVSRSVVAGQMLLAFEASEAPPEQVQVNEPEPETLVKTANFAASPARDDLLQPQPSQRSDTLLREPPASFEPVPLTVEGRSTGWSGVLGHGSSRQRDMLIMLAWLLGLPLALMMIVVLYLGVTTIERVALGTL